MKQTPSHRPTRRRATHKRPMLVLALVLTGFLANCGGLGYTPPPGAKLGDAFLSLTIESHDKSHLPQGADIVISIENPAALEETDKVIIGDVIKLTQPDTAVKINFPIDKHRLKDCGAAKPCQIQIKVVKNGTIRYTAIKPHPYKAGQNKIQIAVSKPT